MTNYVEQANKIAEEFPGFYLKLNLQLPEESINEVQDVFNEDFFVKHRGKNHTGWMSATIHGLDGDWYKTMSGKQYGYTGDSDPSINWTWTEIAEYCPETVRWLKEEFPSDTFRRVRFMLLEPGGYILDHSDYNPRNGPPSKGPIMNAFNCCITQPDDCALVNTKSEISVPFNPLDVYCFNNNVNHHAYNNSEENRFHLIVHNHEYRDDFFKLFIESFEQNYDGHIYE